jgi:hypothetical protein
MEKTLQMVFLNNAGKNVSINIAGIKDNATAAEIKTVMELIITKNIFNSTGGDLKSAMSANLASKEVEALVVR